MEAAMEAERAQLPLWVPVGLGTGICAWFALPTPAHWIAWVMGWLGLAIAIGVVTRGGRLGGALMIGATLLAAGCLLPWGKALLMGAPPLARAAMVQMEARVITTEPLAERGTVRLTLAPIGRVDLPAQVRENAKPEVVPKGLAPGDVIALKARLMPPPTAALPGGYDYAIRAYFSGIGATGRALGDIEMVRAGARTPGLRERLSAHVRSRLSGPEGEIAATLATGDRSGISEADAEAMRRSGLAHLLSISGLHVSALIGGVMLVVYRLLALSPTLALRLPLILIAACAGAAAGLGYTLLTGAEVPTVRSCVAALLVIAGLALGREAISLRLIATGALVVMLLWPEAVIGPSFQMSFAAVTAIVALYEWPVTRDFFARREEGRIRRLLRGLAGLLVTGVAVELVLMPIALYHFHRAGMMGALANLIAIPLTSFVIMPAEVLALLLDVFGLGAPAWAVTGWALALLLAVARHVAALPYAVMAMPAISGALFASTMLGLLWLMLWRGRMRWPGGAVVLIGALLMAMTPAPDILVTADGRHIAVRTGRGYALLRDRAGDYMRDTLAESAGFGGEFDALEGLPAADCSIDVCAVTVKGQGGGQARLLATRTNLRLPWRELVAACAASDIVVSDRRLPQGCAPRWLKLDRQMLGAHGGSLILLRDHRLITGRDPADRHPWVIGRAGR
jgi:competence protein ComEC